jgi:hypothetical protein
MKLDNEYLYGIEDVPSIPNDIIMRRLELLKDNLEELLEHSYYIRDNDRVRAILKSIKYWSSIK